MRVTETEAILINNKNRLGFSQMITGVKSYAVCRNWSGSKKLAISIFFWGGGNLN